MSELQAEITTDEDAANAVLSVLRTAGVVLEDDEVDRLNAVVEHLRGGGE